MELQQIEILRNKLLRLMNATTWDGGPADERIAETLALIGLILLDINRQLTK